MRLTRISYLRLSRPLAVAALTIICASGAKAEVKFDGMIDTYYAYDFKTPASYDRAYTTTAVRSDEFNVNLAYIGASLAQDRLRGRLALQYGTSVQANYSGEPTVGANSGSTLSRHIQEAYAGYQLADGLWIDAGTYFAHVGAESFISRENPTYTRSLVADYSPYYQSGVRLSYQINEKLSAQLHIVNGWQNQSENNRSKMGGTQVAYQLSPKVSVSYNTLFGKEAAFRHFHDFILKWQATESTDVVAQYDLGFQKSVGQNAATKWWGAVLIARQRIADGKWLVARAERYSDPDQTIVATSSAFGFDVTSASVGFDMDLSSSLKWRNEYRHYWATDAVFPAGAGASDASSVAVTSFTLSL